MFLWRHVAWGLGSTRPGRVLKGRVLYRGSFCQFSKHEARTEFVNIPYSPGASMVRATTTRRRREIGRKRTDRPEKVIVARGECHEGENDGYLVIFVERMVRRRYHNYQMVIIIIFSIISHRRDDKCNE